MLSTCANWQRRARSASLRSLEIATWIQASIAALFSLTWRRAGRPMSQTTSWTRLRRLPIQRSQSISDEVLACPELSLVPMLTSWMADSGDSKCPPPAIVTFYEAGFAVAAAPETKIQTTSTLPDHAFSHFRPCATSPRWSTLNGLDCLPEHKQHST